MTSPLVNVLLPTYEPRPGHLRAALDSLLAQTEAGWTALIHDDASQADVRAIVEPYLRDPRVRFERSPRRLGIGGNWNACLERSEAPFVQYLFQDDEWRPDYLATALAVLTRHPDVGFVSVGHAYSYEGEVPTAPLYEEVQEFKKKHLRAGKHTGREFLRWWMEQDFYPNVIGEPSFVLIRRESATGAGRFLEDMPQFLDLEYWTRLLLTGNWYFVPEELGSFRVHAAGASAQNNESGAGLYDRLRCYERLLAVLEPGKEREAALAARNNAVEKMARKFLVRLKTGEKLQAKGGGSLRRFMLRHPALALKSIARALLTPQAAETRAAPPVGGPR